MQQEQVLARGACVAMDLSLSFLPSAQGRSKADGDGAAWAVEHPEIQGHPRPTQPEAAWMSFRDSCICMKV